MKLKVHRSGGAFGFAELIGRERIEHDSEPRPLRERLRQNFELLPRQFDLAQEDAGDVAAGTCKARDIAAFDRIKLDCLEDDRNGTARTNHRLQRDLRPTDHNDVRFGPQQIRSGCERAAGIGNVSLLQYEMLALVEARLAQLRQEGLMVADDVVEWSAEQTDPWNLALLRQRAGRP